MHDTCNCTNKVTHILNRPLNPILKQTLAVTLTLKVATLMVELRDRKCAEHYGEDDWAHADAKTKACFNFLCGNHTRSLPNVRYNKVKSPHTLRTPPTKP
jgi:hypothetical protein